MKYDHMKFCNSCLKVKDPVNSIKGSLKDSNFTERRLG